MVAASAGSAGPYEKGPQTAPQWTLRDWLAAAVLFLATAGVVLWQNAHVAVLFDLSYMLNTAARIAHGQVPYRDFPLAHPPLTFLVQAAIIRLTGRVIFHHVIYTAFIGGLGTVLAWRIALGSLRGRVEAAWLIALLVAAPLSVLGIYCIVPNPEYDCDCGFWILVAVWMLMRVDTKKSTAFGFAAGAALCVPLFFKQNMGLPLLLVALAAIAILIGMELTRRKDVQPDSAVEGNSENPKELASGAKAHVDKEPFSARLKSCPDTKPSFDAGINTSASPPRPDAQTSFSGACSTRAETSSLMAVIAGVCVTLVAAVLALHFTAGIGNYLHWTIEYAGKRRLPGMSLMLAAYRDPSLLWTLPCIVIALLLLRSPLAKRRWPRLAAFALMAAPFLFTIASLFLYDDADERGDALLSLWPLLLVLAAALAIANLFRLRREPSLRAFLPLLLLAAIHGTFMSQQLWGSTYGIWPLLILLVAEMIAFLARWAVSRDQSSETLYGVTNEGPDLISEALPESKTHCAFLRPTRGLKASPLPESPRAASILFVLALAALVSVTLLVCGGFYTASEERLSYANFPDGPPAHSAFPELAGLATPGPYVPEIDELLRYTQANISFDDGILLIPGEEPFYIATNRVPKFPVPFFDFLIDPYSPAEIVSLVRSRDIRWLIVKRNVQTKEDPTPGRKELMKALMSEFTPSAQLHGYDVYRR